jgi:dynein heavy chain
MDFSTSSWLLTKISFLGLIEFYKEILVKSQEEVEKSIARYEQGLNILAETSSKVKGLEEELVIKMEDVKKKEIETDILIQKVSAESAIADEESEKAAEEEKKTNIAAKEAEDCEKEAETALKEALPALEAAKNAIDCIKKAHLSEIKQLAAPAHYIVLTGLIVLSLLGERVTLDPSKFEQFWKKVQQALANPDQFLNKLKTFNAADISPEIIATIGKYVDDPNENFTVANVLR